MSDINMVFSEPSPSQYPWNNTLSGVTLDPAYYTAFTPYFNSNYSAISFQQRSALGEPLPTDWASLQSNALYSLAKYKYEQTPQVNPLQTFANFGGLNEYQFANSQFPPNGLTSL